MRAFGTELAIALRNSASICTANMVSTNLYEIFADTIDGICEIVAEWAIVSSLTCALKEEFTRNVHFIYLIDCQQ